MVTFIRTFAVTFCLFGATFNTLFASGVSHDLYSEPEVKKPRGVSEFGWPTDYLKYIRTQFYNKRRTTQLVFPVDSVISVLNGTSGLGLDSIFLNESDPVLSHEKDLDSIRLVMEMIGLVAFETKDMKSEDLAEKVFDKGGEYMKQSLIVWILLRESQLLIAAQGKKQSREDLDKAIYDELKAGKIRTLIDKSTGQYFDDAKLKTFVTKVLKGHRHMSNYFPVELMVDNDQKKESNYQSAQEKIEIAPPEKMTSDPKYPEDRMPLKMSAIPADVKAPPQLPEGKKMPLEMSAEPVK